MRRAGNHRDKPLPPLPTDQIPIFTGGDVYSDIEIESDAGQPIYTDVRASSKATGCIVSADNYDSYSSPAESWSSNGQFSYIEPLEDYENEYSELSSGYNSEVYTDAISDSVTVDIAPQASQVSAPCKIKPVLQTSSSFDINTIKIREVRNRLRPSVTQITAQLQATSVCNGVSKDIIEADSSPTSDQPTSVRELRRRFEVAAASSGVVQQAVVHRSKSEPGWQSSASVSPACMQQQHEVPHPVTLLTTASTTNAMERTKTNHHGQTPPPRPPKNAPLPSRDTLRNPIQTDLQHGPWFVSKMNQTECESNLMARRQEGAFLVRESTRGDPWQPYTLLVYHQNTVFTLMIRRKTNGKMALGSEKIGEQEFSSIEDLVNYHRTCAIGVVGGVSNTNRNDFVCLSL